MFSNHPKIRITIYLIAVAAQVTGFFVRIYSPELGGAFSDSADLLAVIAIGTALTNLTPTPGVNAGYTSTQVGFRDNKHGL